MTAALRLIDLSHIRVYARANGAIGDLLIDALEECIGRERLEQLYRHPLRGKHFRWLIGSARAGAIIDFFDVDELCVALDVPTLSLPEEVWTTRRRRPRNGNGRAAA